MQKVYTADYVFTGVEHIPDYAVIVKDDVIENVLPIISLPKDLKTDAHCSLLVPAFIDIQIYGASKKLFSVFPSANTLQLMYEHCVGGGAHFFLPTVATNTSEVFYECIDAVKEYNGNGGKGVPGLHLEGPWINKLKRGAHMEALIHSPDIKEVTDLLEYGRDVIKIITLAPEVCSNEIIDLIHSYRIIVSAGHSNATFKEATRAFNNGIHLVTHLFNAMSPLHHREAGLAGAVIQHPYVMSSIIADGYHVDFEVIKIAKKLVERRLFLITDAVTETTEGCYLHQREGDKYTSNGVLSGSSITMLQSVKNCISKVGIEMNEALRMASLYPAKVLGIDHQYGMIQKGYAASFVRLDENMDIINEDAG
ncbi:MAG: N-acetylglucosamine-6-phosphate deacetylase [Ginsengibacter sp.]